jgi:uncharacterized membrane protein
MRPSLADHLRLEVIRRYGDFTHELKWGAVNVVLWIVAAVLAAVFLASGVIKVVQPREKLIASGMGWAGSIPAGAVKLLGALEILGAIGLILPAVTGIAPILVPLAAAGLVLVMIGGIVVHARRGETPMIAANAVLLILAALVAWGRFGPYSF